MVFLTAPGAIALSLHGVVGLGWYFIGALVMGGVFIAGDIRRARLDKQAKDRPLAFPQTES